MQFLNKGELVLHILKNESLALLIRGISGDGDIFVLTLAFRRLLLDLGLLDHCLAEDLPDLIESGHLSSGEESLLSFLLDQPEDVFRVPVLDDLLHLDVEGEGFLEVEPRVVG